MLKPLCLAAALLAPSVVAGATPDDLPVVHYTLSPVLAADTLAAVRITLAFTGEADGSTELNLPDQWADETELYRGLRNLEVRGGSLGGGQDPAHRVVTHDPGAALTVSYEAIQDRPGAPRGADGNSYRPLVQPTYFHLIGDAVFVEPAWPSYTPAEFQVTGLPAGWGFASDLEHGRPGHPLTLADVRESITVGGDFRVVVRHHADGDLRVALRGSWSFTDDGLADKIDRIVAANRRFWGDPDEPFLVTVLPLVTDGSNSSLGGTGRSDAFAFFATSNGQESTLNRVLAHEHLHTWIPRRIGRMPEGEQNEAADYWLSEGFTDYYAHRLLVREGIWTPEEWLAATNEVLAKYAQSSLRAAPNSRIVADFWKSREAQDLPYQRGFLLALLWDYRLRSLNHAPLDLDQVMLAMHRAYMPVRTEKDAPQARAAFLAAMKAVGYDATKEFRKYVLDGAPVLLPADLMAPGLTVETVNLAEFDRGFDPLKTTANDNRITGLDPKSPAYAAGLREGMKILKRESGRPGDSSVEFVYRVLVDGQEKLIHYFPRGKRKYLTQRFVARDGAPPEELRKMIGG